MERDKRFLPIVDPEKAAIPSAAGPPVFERIAVIGLGAIGGSIALAARAAWPTVLVIGVDANDALERAVVRHAIDVGASSLGIVSGAELIVLAAPEEENVGLLGQLADHVEQAAVVTDVGGAPPELAEAARALPPHLAFIGGHPQVEVPGPGIAQARADLFVGRPWVFTPAFAAPSSPGGAPEDPLAALFRFVEALGGEPRLAAPTP
jgi:prephenate dehydrogenase